MSITFGKRNPMLVDPLADATERGRRDAALEQVREEPTDRMKMVDRSDFDAIQQLLGWQNDQIRDYMEPA